MQKGTDSLILPEVRLRVHRDPVLSVPDREDESLGRLRVIAENTEKSVFLYTFLSP
jgi:hypothetical protein